MITSNIPTPKDNIVQALNNHTHIYAYTKNQNLIIEKASLLRRIWEWATSFFSQNRSNPTYVAKEIQRFYHDKELLTAVNETSYFTRHKISIELGLESPPIDLEEVIEIEDEHEPVLPKNVIPFDRETYVCPCCELAPENLIDSDTPAVMVVQEQQEIVLPENPIALVEPVVIAVQDEHEPALPKDLTLNELVVNESENELELPNHPLSGLFTLEDSSLPVDQPKTQKSCGQRAIQVAKIGLLTIAPLAIVTGAAAGIYAMTTTKNPFCVLGCDWLYN